MSKADRIRKNRILSKPLSQNPSPNTEPHQYVQYFSKTINKISWKYFKLILVCLFFLIFALEHSSNNGSDSFYSLFHSRFGGYLSKQQEESGLHFHEIMESNYKPVKQKGNPSYSENFTTNYYQMEMKFKVYMYPEDEVLNKYYQNGSEGYFFKNIKDSQFRTTVAQEAHLFFIPIRTHQMHNMGTSNEEMAIVVQNYVQSLITENPYWNKSQGADHFFINCHEIGVMATKGLPLMKNAIQVVCTSLDALEFNPFKDIIIPAQDLKPSTTTRKVVRDSELDRNYCSCQLSPFRAACMVESILEECVPAIVTFLNLDLPFNDTLDWTRFSIIGRTKGVHLNGEKLNKLHNNLLEIRKHFQWNSPPVRLDAFHMVIYELWQHARRLHFT